MMPEDEFRELYDKHARAVWAYVVRICRDPSVADDVVQETFVRILDRDVSRLSPVQRKSYLFRTAVNLTTDYFRRRKRQTALDELANLAASHESNVSIDLDRAFQQLEPRQRALLWMAYAEGCTHEEIGDILNVKTRSVKVLLFRARKKLMDVLNKMGW